MKSNYLRSFIVLWVYFIGQPAIAGGTDLFTTTQSATEENIEIICASSFSAPYDNLYAYESVWNWVLFGGFWSTVPVKVGEKYTGEFTYTGMSCTASRKIHDLLTQQDSIVEVSFDFDINGQLLITSSNVPLNISIEDYKNTYETATLLFTISKLAYDINNTGLVATAISRLSLASLQEAAIFSIIAKLVSDSVFIYIEQKEIKQQISNFMNNEAATTTKNVAEQILTDITQLEATYKYIIIMPAINYLLL